MPWRNFHSRSETFQQLLAEGKHVSEDSRLIDEINWNYLLGLGHLGLREFQQAEAALSLRGHEAWQAKT